MDEPLDELYLRWLYGQVANVRTRVRARTYWGLLRQLYTTEFVWFVPNDDNRVVDGLELRNEFLQDSELEVDENWMLLGCSFLEMMIALCRHLAFETEGKVAFWFWRLIENLDLEDITDAVYPTYSHDDISEKLNAVLWRRYHPSGEGGLFPLKQAPQDQTKVELWYQMNTYLIEYSQEEV